VYVHLQEACANKVTVGFRYFLGWFEVVVVVVRRTAPIAHGRYKHVFFADGRLADKHVANQHPFQPLSISLRVELLCQCVGA
jgi:hypothetical protein